MLKQILKPICLLPILTLIACTGHQTSIQPVALDENYTKPRIDENFDDYVEFLKGKALTKGVSKRVVKRNDVTYIAKVIEIDQKQASKKSKSKSKYKPKPKPKSKFTKKTKLSKSKHKARVPKVTGLTRYLNRVITDKKLELAVTKYEEHKKTFVAVNKKTGIPQNVILALWGVESLFGKYQGSYDVLSVLATLAFDGRREKLFTNEFISALQMLNQGYISRDKMKGSWAGAMGQSQFMPTSYLNYAIDMDRDGKKDIWHNEKDVLGSIATYLATVGWDTEVPWGVEVKLTKPIPMQKTGFKTVPKSLQAWKRLGVILKNPYFQEQKNYNLLTDTYLWLIRPDKEKGRAFLVTNNYKTILHWNNSHYFTISVGKFSDMIQQRIGY